MKSVNLKELAKQLNLSISTVSKALRDNYEIGQETKDRVKSLASELNYEPNPYASSLRRKKSQTIGVIVPEVANNFFSQVINGIEEVARQNDYHVLIYLTNESYSRELTITHHLASGRVDGILMSVASESQNFSHLKELTSKNIPIVFFDRVCDELSTAKVTTNDFESGYTATKHLIEAGCSCIAHLLISSNLSIGQKRMQGYVKALEDHGIAYDASLVLNGDNTDQENRKLIKQLLQNTPKLDGIFASVERLAMSSYEACNELNISIPGDIKIIGFSNLYVASLLNPALTTIRQPAYTMGKGAANILFAALNSNKPVSENQSLEISSELIIRKSTSKI